MFLYDPYVCAIRFIIAVSTSRLFLSHGVSSSYMDFVLTKPGLETTYTKLRFQGS